VKCGEYFITLPLLANWILTHNFQLHRLTRPSALLVDGLADVLADGGPAHLLQDQALSAHDDLAIRIGVQNVTLR